MRAKPSPLPEASAKQGAEELLAAEEASYNRSFSSHYKSRIQKLSVENIRDFKTRLENAITTDPISYNSAAKSLGHGVETHQLQCYSGTALLIAAAASTSSQADFEKVNFVVINSATEGEAHVLPGFVVVEGENFRLFGIEMTAEGSALHDFGRTDLIRAPMKVVEAIDWLKIEAQRTSAEANQARVPLKFVPDNSRYSQMKSEAQMFSGVSQ